MQFTLNVFHCQHGAAITWTTLGLGALTTTRRGAHVGKVQQSVLDELRTRIAALKPAALEQLEFHRSTRLATVHLELSLRDEGRKRKVSLRCPLVVETRALGPGRTLTLAYHPLAQNQWFPVRDGEELAEQAALYFAQAWATRTDEEIDALRLQGRVSLRAVAFNAEPRTLLDELPKKQGGAWDDLTPDRDRDRRKGRGGTRVLASIAEDLTARALGGELPVPTARARFREQLRTLLTATPGQSCVLVGPSGAGRTTLLHQAVHDLIAADEYPAHRNADRVRHVWRLSGKRIIAGMSHLGEWEQRCLDLLDDARHKRAVLFVDDLHLFGRIGRSRDSERSLAEFFRGPVQRGELLLVGECTAEQWQRLDDDAAGFASLFSLVHIAPADEAETLRTLLQARRELELDHRVEIRFDALRTVMDLGGALVPNRANPGKSVDLLKQLAREHPGPPSAPGAEALALTGRAPLRVLETADVVRLLSARTGLSQDLVSPSTPLPPEAITAALSASVMGQPEAIAAAVDLVTRIRAGLTDPRRPYAVYLFTGPTGTGKTELSRALARYLYGDESRLLRFDMAEYGGPDAVSRLVGDRWNPDGALTRAVTQQPFCVVLFDEVEKAHPMAHNLLLQLLEDGRLTDAAGVTASFTHAVVVMTSNLGARAQSPAGFGDRAVTDTTDHLRAVREFFSPELFNRIDRVVPFRALTPEVAREVAAKELAKITQRRGLLDRNVFVTAAPAVLDRVVAQAFRSADGARSLKRHLEDVIGTRLTEHLVSGPQAELQMVRLHATDEGLSLEIDALSEAPGSTDRFPLLDLADAPLSTLRAKLPEALAEVDAVLTSPALQSLSEEVSARLAVVRAEGVGADPEGFLATLDHLRGAVITFRAELEALTRAASESEDWETRALALFARERPSASHRSVSMFSRRSVADEVPPLRDAILDALARAGALRRQVSLARDPAQHEVLVHLQRAPGSGPRSNAEELETLFHQLRVAYLRAFGEVTEFAAQVDVPMELGPARVTSPMRDVDAVTLRIMGPCVRDALSLEHGTHIWHRTADAPEVVRVVVEPASPGLTALTALSARLAARKTRDEEARRGGVVAADALSVVRTIRFTPSARRGESSRWGVEDFVLGYARETSATELTAPLRELFTLRSARVTPG
jgi:ATP-dependent Clp protease ATP-binding subunit ClpA/ATP-dependent Clp protease ATP-binding subunit ClpC